jgi:hypothetical protein
LVCIHFNVFNWQALEGGENSVAQNSGLRIKVGYLVAEVGLFVFACALMGYIVSRIRKRNRDAKETELSIPLVEINPDDT